MSCREGFDPFGDRDAELLAHAATCAHCGEVVRVLDACGAAWKSGLVDDRARGFFRARRLGRPRPPARTAMTTLVLVTVVAALSGYALARRSGPRDAVEQAPTVQVAPAESSRPAPSAPPSTTRPEPAPIDEPTPQSPPHVEATAPRAPIETASDLWRRATALLDAGDRAGAERGFRRVMDMSSSEPGLRRRATFRWAQLLLSRGDTGTPREPLMRLVRGGDALGFDAALLLERCAPEDRARTWDAYLDVARDPALRERAMQHR